MTRPYARARAHYGFFATSALLRLNLLHIAAK